jgi:hypothetical protein
MANVLNNLPTHTPGNEQVNTVVILSHSHLRDTQLNYYVTEDNNILPYATLLQEQMKFCPIESWWYLQYSSNINFNFHDSDHTHTVPFSLSW